MHIMPSKPDPKSPPPRYASVDEWTRLSGISRTVTYDRIAKGELKAVKVGRRTLVDVEHGLSWIASQPALPRRPNVYAA